MPDLKSIRRATKSEVLNYRPERSTELTSPLLLLQCLPDAYECRISGSPRSKQQPMDGVSRAGADTLHVRFRKGCGIHVCMLTSMVCHASDVSVNILEPPVLVGLICRFGGQLDSIIPITTRTAHNRRHCATEVPPGQWQRYDPDPVRCKSTVNVIQGGERNSRCGSRGVRFVLRSISGSCEVAGPDEQTPATVTYDPYAE